jgi:hypothetical protein
MLMSGGNSIGLALILMMVEGRSTGLNPDYGRGWYTWLYSDDGRGMVYWSES